MSGAPGNSPQLAPYAFKPGQSGNPAGESGVALDIRKTARAYGQRALEVLAEIMNDKDARKSDRITATVALLDRGFGKPKEDITQHVDLADRISAADRSALLGALEAVARNTGVIARRVEEAALGRREGTEVLSALPGPGDEPVEPGQVPEAP